jgi:signal transduction histidine kinase
VLAGIARSTQGLISEIRRVVDDLRPRVLDQLGLISAVQEKASAFTSGHAGGVLTVTVESHGDFSDLPAATEVAAYRIATEALTNVARHAGATRCHVILTVDHGSLVVSVEDDGVGMPGSYRPGVGIGSMRERANELGGSFLLAANPVGGSRLTARLPLSGGAFLS